MQKFKVQMKKNGSVESTCKCELVSGIKYTTT